MRSASCTGRGSFRGCDSAFQCALIRFTCLCLPPRGAQGRQLRGVTSGGSDLQKGKPWMKQTWSDLELQQKCRRWCPGPGNILGQHPGRGGGEGGGSRRTGPGPGCRTFSGFRGERHPALFRSKRRLLPLKRDKAEQHQENIRLDCHRGAGHAPLPGFRLALASLAPHLDLLTCRGCPTHGSACPLFILLGCLSCWLLFLEDRKRGREVEREKRD